MVGSLLILSTLSCPVELGNVAGVFKSVDDSNEYQKKTCTSFSVLTREATTDRWSACPRLCRVVAILFQTKTGTIIAHIVFLKPVFCFSLVGDVTCCFGLGSLDFHQHAPTLQNYPFPIQSKTAIYRRHKVRNRKIPLFVFDPMTCTRELTFNLAILISHLETPRIS